MAISIKEKLAIMDAVKKAVVDYLEDQKSIIEDALTAYEDNSPINNLGPEISKMREQEAILLRRDIQNLRRHISVINKMFPEIKKQPDASKKTAKKKA